MSTGDRDNVQDGGPDPLDPIVLAVVRDEKPEIEELPDVALSAYLRGKAAAAEKDAVRQVLSRSAAARRNVIELGKYLDALSASSAVQRFREAEAPRFDLVAHTLPEPVPRPTWRQRWIAAWDLIAAAPSWKLAASACALVLMAGTGVVGSRLFSLQPLAEPVVARYDAEILAPRGGDPRRGRRGEAPGQHQVAALQQFRSCVAYRDGVLELVGPAEHAVDGDVTVQVHLVDSHRRKRSTLTTAITGEQAQLWIASGSESASGQFEVRSLALGGRSATVRLADVAARGVWLVTYEHDGRVYATECAEYSVAGR